MIRAAGPQVEFLYTNIGRGHPFYLDGIIEAMVRRGSIGLVRSQSDVFEVSDGVSLLMWKIARWLYKRGASEGIVGHAYGRIRRDNSYDPDNFSVRLLGRRIRNTYGQSDIPLLVAHPLLVATLSGRKRLIYQHGEAVVPSEAVVAGAETVIVPTEAAAEPFYGSGYDRDSVFVSGLCIEPALVAQAETAFDSRLERIELNSILTGAFYSSGAEPAQHVARLVAVAQGVVKGGGRAVIFAQKNGRLESCAVKEFSSAKIPLSRASTSSLLPSDLPAALLISFAARREETRLTAKLFPYFDYFASPAHERTNWALGLGFPMFITLPAIGPFAPLNQKILVDSGAAVELNSAPDLVPREKLARMALAGWKKYPIDGFTQIADYIAEYVAAK